MKFLIGLAVGALGIWAYKSGKLQKVTGQAPEPVQQVFGAATERINQVVSADPVRQVAATVQDRVQRANTPEIAMPSAAEVAGRPSEPLPGQEPENIQVQNA